MADVINETGEDVVYEVDDGGGPGGDELRAEARQEKKKKICDGPACAGWLAKGTNATGLNKVYGVYPEGNAALVVSFWRADRDEVIAIKNRVRRGATVRLKSSGITAE